MSKIRLHADFGDFLGLRQRRRAGGRITSRRIVGSFALGGTLLDEDGDLFELFLQFFIFL